MRRPSTTGTADPESGVAAAIRGALRVAVGRRGDVAGFAAMAARLWTILGCELPEGTSLTVRLGRQSGGMDVAVESCCVLIVFDAAPQADPEAVRRLVARAASNALEAAADNHAEGRGCTITG